MFGCVSGSMTNSETAPLKATFSNKIELLNYVLMSWDLGLILLEVIRNAKSTPLPTSDFRKNGDRSPHLNMFGKAMFDGKWWTSRAQIVMFIPLSPLSTVLTAKVLLRIASGVVISNIPIMAVQRLHCG